MKFFLLLTWLFSIMISVFWTYDNPDKIEVIKSKIKKFKEPEQKYLNEDLEKLEVVEANSFKVSHKKIISLNEKTAFINSNIKNGEKFDKNKITIFTQTGYKIQNRNIEKLNLGKNFHLESNGGIKTIITANKKTFGLISSKRGDCYYASINEINSGEELFKTDCLPKQRKKFDFNGLGTSFINFRDTIYMSLGTPTRNSDKISQLAQNENSFFGKIIAIKKKDFNEKKLNPQIFSSGHRTPQGMTRINDKFFSVEHGPKGGDELNRIKDGRNYGWPTVSYGTKYNYDNKGKSYNLDHEAQGFEEPIFAFVPSIGISALNNCPKILKQYYKKNCLMGLSLYGNDLRQGKSIIIFLLNKELNKINSIEKIYLGGNYPLRHFVTDSNNELFEDNDGNIYVSIDKKGIFRINFF